MVRRFPETLVIEDDHSAAVSGAESRTLVDRRLGRWAVVRTVSKTLGPDLRLAVLAGDATTVARVEGRRLLSAGWVSSVVQMLVLGIHARGRSGFNVWIPVAQERAPMRLVLEAGWAVSPGERFRVTSPPGLRVTAATLTPDESRRFAADLARALHPGARSYGG